MEMGRIILDAYPEMSVDVHKPDIMLNIEVRDRFIFIPKSFRDLAVC